MHAVIASLPGDGIGPEVTSQAVRVLQAVAQKFGHQFEITEALIGGAAVDGVDDPMPKATMDLCKSANAILLGAVGGPKWDDAPKDKRPEIGLLSIRKDLNLFANLRPVVPNPLLFAASPLRPELLINVDILFVRELTGGIYFGEKQRHNGTAMDQCIYTTPEIERVVRVACKSAMQRDKRITSVDKANVLETSKLWREVTQRVVDEEYPDIQLDHLLVDAAAMHLLSRPADFDVIVTENMFGDILTDECSMLAGSLGLLPSASLADGSFGLYEPIHGSAPDIAGKGIANPYGSILSAAMLLRHSLGLEAEAQAVEAAVNAALENGTRSRDLVASDADACSTVQVGDAVVTALGSA